MSKSPLQHLTSYCKQLFGKVSDSLHFTSILSLVFDNVNCLGVAGFTEMQNGIISSKVYFTAYKNCSVLYCRILHLHQFKKRKRKKLAPKSQKRVNPTKE